MESPTKNVIVLNPGGDYCWEGGQPKTYHYFPQQNLCFWGFKFQVLFEQMSQIARRCGGGVKSSQYAVLQWPRVDFTNSNKLSSMNLQGGPLAVINGVKYLYKWPDKLVTGVITLPMGVMNGSPEAKSWDVQLEFGSMARKQPL